MLGAAVVAVALAGATSLATPASAALMVTRIIGDYNDDPMWRWWEIEMRYDTSHFASPVNGVYHWNAASGTPSPLLDVKGYVQGDTCAPWDAGIGLCTSSPFVINFDRSSFTSFTIIRSPSNYDFTFEGPGIYFGGMGFYSVASNPKIDENFTMGAYGNYGYGEINGLPVGMLHTEFLSVTKTSVPEPAAWAMMIAGFGLAGGALRHRRGSAAARLT